MHEMLYRDAVYGMMTTILKKLNLNCRLVKTVENAAAVELKCLLISAQSVNISQVWIRILTTVKNVEYVGKEHDQILLLK